MSCERIVLLGGPGSGKGVQGTRLAAALGLAYLSSGQLARDEWRRGTPLGERLAEYFAAGRLVPDDLIVETLRGPLRAADGDCGWLLDGFPRTERQRDRLDAVLGPVTAAVYLRVGDDELRSRLLARGRAGDRPDDQSVEVVDRRIADFHHTTAPVVEAYRERGLLVEVDGEGDPDTVAERVLDGLRAVLVR